MESEAINPDDVIATVNEIGTRLERMQCEIATVMTGLADFRRTRVDAAEAVANYDETKAACVRARFEIFAIETLLAKLPAAALDLWDQLFPGGLAAHFAGGKLAIAKVEEEFAEGERLAALMMVGAGGQA